MEKKLKDMGVELNELAIAMCDYIQTGQKMEQLSKFWDNEEYYGKKKPAAKRDERKGFRISRIRKGYGNTWENGNEIDEFHRFICKNGNNRRTT